MFDASNFLMRWLFLCNLVKDMADIQTIPYEPHPPPLPPQATPVTPSSCEQHWRSSCFREIASCPPGSPRCLVLDALRAQLVQRLAFSLRAADDTLRKTQKQKEKKERVRRKKYRQNQLIPTDSDGLGEGVNDGKDKDPHLDADSNVLKSFEQVTFLPHATRQGQEYITGKKSPDQPGGSIEATASGKMTFDAANQPGTVRSKGPPDKGQDSMPSQEEIEDAQETIRHVRDYLPQLVSAVLKSPPAFEPRLINPIQKLRRLLVERCLEDANWGIHMCWLLEAEVGRAWKSLFESRQQTGRRLIIVMPADKAAVIAKIGREKGGAFDLLQDSEQATAYGYTESMDRYRFASARPVHNEYNRPFMSGLNAEEEELYKQSKLPSSLSLRRCSHFGDTMHFIDLMTKISLDMRHIAIPRRTEYLHKNLREINRRLRRRMVTRGDISLDVDDNGGPDDWPLLSDISTEMLRHSIHLPFDPMQSKRWTGGIDPSEDLPDGGVVRVLNIVVDDARILSSRERCPYLIHVEVAETGLRGNDARLYASGIHGLGATVEEALGLSSSATKLRESRKDAFAPQNFPLYDIPPELLPVDEDEGELISSDESDDDIISISEAAHFREPAVPRGGWQGDMYPHDAEEVYNNPYDTVRQSEYEQLHEQLHVQEEVQGQMQPYDPGTSVTTGETLLDNVFGQPWVDKCEEIRQTSAFGGVKGWRLASFIMKAGEDIRRESLVMQIIYKLNEWFKTDIPEKDRPHLRPYSIMCVGGDAGIVECLSDAKSIDEVKKRTDKFYSLRNFFERAFGQPGGTPATFNGVSFDEAQDNFLRSLVGYSLVCYILQIKDRHNANILLDRRGNIMHIDFGFVLGDTPKMGKVPIFSERAPFKLSAEFWEVLGGWHTRNGGLGVRFCQMFDQAFACAASHVDEIASLVEATMMTLTQNINTARRLSSGVRMRLRMRGKPGSNEQQAFIMELVDASLSSWGTSTYDWLQKNMNGYQ